jgi:hypothetical protein
MVAADVPRLRRDSGEQASIAVSRSPSTSDGPVNARGWTIRRPRSARLRTFDAGRRIRRTRTADAGRGNEEPLPSEDLDAGRRSRSMKARIFATLTKSSTAAGAGPDWTPPLGEHRDEIGVAAGRRPSSR